MKLQLGQKAVVFGLLTFGACITCAVIAHYCEIWIAFIPVAFLFSIISFVTIATDGE